MQITTIIGYAALVLAIVFGIVFGDNGIDFGLMKNFLNGPSVFITIGGTIFTLLAAFPMESFKKIPKHIKLIFKEDKKDPYEYVEIITELSREARKKGLLSLEDKAYGFTDEFLKESVLLIVDSIEPDKLREWLEQKLFYIDKRNQEERRIYDLGAALGPAFGMIGTLIGLVNMLKAMNFDNGAETLGANMSVALITTFYGSLLANGLFIPVANKLEIIQEKEMLLMELISEGVIAIKQGENPNYIQQKLTNFLEGKDIKAKKEGEEDNPDKKEKRRKRQT